MAFFFMTGRYHKRMRRLAFFLLAILAPSGMAQPLPDLGGPGDAVLPPATERRIGESIVRDIRRDPSYVDDPEVAEYLASVGAKLTQVSGGGRQDFEFFAVRDPAINAFALPGGFVGVHTGLVTSAETESELASVLAHEIAHVTQRHIARLFGTQQQMNMPVMVALAAAILLGRSRPDLASGAAAAAQGVAAATTLSYTRDFEREADRVGLQSLAAAGFEPRAMSAFFERMQRVQRVADDGTVPGYLRTHPVTTERIADAQNRAATLPYKQHLASTEFHLVRAKLRAEAGDAHDTVTSLQSAVRDGRFASEAAARFGLVHALLRVRKVKEAETEMALLRKTGTGGPMIETLAARVKQAAGDAAGAAALLAEARTRYPHSRPVLYAHVDALHGARRDEEAMKVLDEAQRTYSRDARLYALQSKTYAALGKRLLQHQAQAEFYALQGNLPGAIEQMQLARSAGDGDFYQQSVVDARLRELRTLHSNETRK
jgi:predicted Zn-dependent protease